MQVALVINSEAREFNVDDDSTLLELLREHSGITSTKDGCSPQGQCGACLVLLDGKPRVACATSVAAAAGKSVLTLEGLSTDERRLYAAAFRAAGAVQCGFCIPGIVMRAHAILATNPAASRAELARKLDVHLCRCTGYQKILDAIESVARARRGDALRPTDDSGRVGTSLGRYKAEELVLGTRPYVADLRFDGMLHAAVVLSPHARARVLRIDTRAAAALGGVARVATARDIPGTRHVGLIENDWPVLVNEGELTRCVGDVLAVVAATDRRTARAAARLVAVDYDVLEPVIDPQAALLDTAPKIHAQGNLLSVARVTRGDAGAALDASTHVVEGVWQTQRVEHLYLEPEAAVVVPHATHTSTARLTLYSQGQGIFDDRRQVAAVLDLPEDEVEVILVPNGGAFGGKEDMSVQAHAALLAHLTERPVALVLSREESLRMHPKRHPIRMHYRVGCNADGRLTAVWARMVGDTGAYASVGAKVLERAAGHACGAYRVPHVDVEAKAVYTNNPPCGAMRGFGANQAHFAIEGALDRLAEKVGLDGWQMRWLNAVEVGDTFASGQVFEKSVGLKKTLLAVKDAFYANIDRAGIACGIKNCGIGNGAKEWGKARLVVDAPDKITIYNGYTEMGQGLLTVLIQCACETTGLPARLFEAGVDTRFQLACGQTTGSRATLFGGKAVQTAAAALRRDLDAGKTLTDLVGRIYEGEHLCDDTHALGAAVARPKTHTAFGFATQVVILAADGKLQRVVAAHDVGRVINPTLCEGQIEGSVHMGLGYALTEEMQSDRGMPATFRLRDYGILRAKDMPPVEVILIEDPEPEGPFGAKGVGEIGLVPTAAAVAGALYKHDGRRRTILPMRDSAAARAIIGRGRHGALAGGSTRAGGSSGAA